VFLAAAWGDFGGRVEGRLVGEEEGEVTVAARKWVVAVAAAAVVVVAAYVATTQQQAVH
jgi:hypothetical protein